MRNRNGNVNQKCAIVAMTLWVTLIIFGPQALAGGREGNVYLLDPRTTTFLFHAFGIETSGASGQWTDDGYSKLRDVVNEYLDRHSSELIYEFDPAVDGPRRLDLVVCLLQKNGHLAGTLMNESTRRFCAHHVRP